MKAVLELLPVMLLGSACASPFAVRRAGVHHFETEPSGVNSEIVLYRSLERFANGGTWLPAAVSVDGEKVGELTNGKYVAIEVPAGNHRVDLEAQSGKSQVLITVLPGGVRSVQVHLAPLLGFTEPDAEDAKNDLENDGDPLELGFKYSFVSR
jgi:hypothetical protein